MKKLMFVLLLIVSIGFLAAVESDPSAVVGYFKTDVAQDGWVPFVIPFGNYATMHPNDVLGVSGYQNGDQISELSTGLLAEFVESVDYTGWDGIDEMVLGSAYWFHRINPAFSMFLLGTVAPSPLTIFVAGEADGSWAPFGLNECVPIPITDLNITGVVNGDWLIKLSTGENAQYVDDPGNFVGWDTSGGVENIDPKEVYWYQSFAPASYTWDYVPAGAPARAQTISNNPFRTTIKK